VREGNTQRLPIRKFFPATLPSIFQSTKILPKSEAIEERIARASEAMDQDPRLRGTKATVQFVVPYNRLMARQRGRPASNSRGGYNKKLLVL
jgi:hypothetical protein